MSAHVLFALQQRALSEGLTRELSILMGSRQGLAYRFSIAPEGSQPLASIAGFAPDIVVIDGKRARQVLLQLPSGSQALRVVVYTQFDQLSLAQALVGLGATAVVNKLSDQATMLEALDACVQGRQYVDGAFRSVGDQVQLRPDVPELLSGFGSPGLMASRCW